VAESGAGLEFRPSAASFLCSGFFVTITIHNGYSPQLNPTSLGVIASKVVFRRLRSDSLPPRRPRVWPAETT